ncbi:MarR family transcriptional regulator [Kitasatospora herbaricolor]|uniref:MarR family winged helix-turn-helix transcriptional regulator n=1 Tax=Kitasatospora herbaricolor TaxID=68217 RepID=UPI00174E9A3E|nr:MarR family transcriptional regulator [Kitasatospora herbaricolor]MDQ0307684.1 DNA-binding MarR family transcriptional regulator [Kitasatospora herbaricolor]GGV15881.1 MarR family transcriptional regulator [Kitasatospora herbaricolor]
MSASATPVDPPEPAVDPLELAADLRSALGNLVRALRVGDELPQNQAGVLGLLVREGPHTTSELADRQHVRHQSMARTVALLTQAGLVRQERHATDGRKLLLAATEAGTAALHAQRARREGEIAAAITERLTPEEQAVLRQSVGLLRRLG